jgi:hopanoid biosynthesis associated protein HpnK
LKRLIITGDDFGLAAPVNEAIAEAHRRGVLTTASLMVGAAAAADAVGQAHRLPSLRVGLHLVLVEGRPVLPPVEVSGLVGAGGEFSPSPARTGFNLCRPSVRRQAEAEIRAQFEAFRRTGLRLDHVNAHNHLHIHPMVLGMILKVGRDFGMQAVRLPWEPPVISWQAAGRGLASKLGASAFLAPWLGLMRSRLRRAGMRTNQYLFGMADSGRMTLDRALEFVRRLPEGDGEIYFHPATRRCPEIAATMPEYRHVDEFRALIDPALAGAIARAGAQLISFADL